MLCCLFLLVRVFPILPLYQILSLSLHTQKQQAWTFMSSALFLLNPGGEGRGQEGEGTCASPDRAGAGEGAVQGEGSLAVSVYLDRYKP